MKYKTEIIKIKKKILKEYDTKFYFHEWVWFFVWLSFAITFVACGIIYFKT